MQIYDPEQDMSLAGDGGEGAKAGKQSSVSLKTGARKAEAHCKLVGHEVT